MTEPRKITNDDLNRILAAYPKLSEFGHDHPDARDSDKLASARASLRRDLDDVQSSYDWLLTLHPAPAEGRWPTSYGLKHDGEHSGKLGYVTNGAMIVAALLAEAPIRIGTGPNPAIGLSLTAPRPAPPEGSFTAWLMQHREAQHPIGDLARDVEADDTWPIDGVSVDDTWPAEAGSYQVYYGYLARVGASRWALDALREAWTAYSGSAPPEDEEL